MKRGPLIRAYCDGSCPKPNGVGGWAYILLFPGEEISDAGFAPLATNQTMELYAALRALRALRDLGCRGDRVEIVSDSQYLVKGMMEWGEGWKARNYEGIKNADLWKRLHNHQGRCSDLIFTWVKGHANARYNEQCDQMAGRAQRQGVEALANRRTRP